MQMGLFWLSRTVWATKVGIVLKNRTLLVLLEIYCAKFVGFFCGIGTHHQTQWCPNRTNDALFFLIFF